MNEEDRRKLLDTAVKFLANPRVAGSPEDHKIEFLKKKGLSKDEIEWALGQVKVTDTSVGSSLGYTWHHVMLGGLAIGSLIGLAVYKLLGFSYQQRSAVEGNVQELLTRLTESVSTLQESTAAIKTLIEQQQVAQQTRSNRHLQDVQNELNTIKGLLLSRHQFPSTPSATSQGGSIPSWQRSQDDKDNESESD